MWSIRVAWLKKMVIRRRKRMARLVLECHVGHEGEPYVAWTHNIS